MHCVKSVRIWSYAGPYFPTFRLNTERYGVSLRTQSDCGKIRTRITPNIDTFYALNDYSNDFNELLENNNDMCNPQWSQ